MRTSLLLILLLIAENCMAQQYGNLSIVYDISISKTKRSSGLEETYNGGTKAVFITGNKARIRMVSLMRIESIFFNFDSTLQQAVVIKESGASKYRFNLNAPQWQSFNKKYDGVTCSFENDSLVVAGYRCKKAVINLSSGENIIAYYTDSIKPVNNFIEPSFNCVPGIVLQYEYRTNRGVVEFKASQVSREVIEKNIFVIPSAGVRLRTYSAEDSND
jgi:GLPGLI family protein